MSPQLLNFQTQKYNNKTQRQVELNETNMKIVPTHGVSIFRMINLILTEYVLYRPIKTVKWIF